MLHKPAFAIALLLLGAGVAPAALSQAVAETAPAAARAQDPAVEPSRSNQTVERIRTEDAGSRIDELRVGGQTRSIVVQPKLDVPAYEVRPADARGPSGQGGARVWNFLRF
ncbi:MAG: hypothetical protein RLZZ180_2483 [Pseudomonadota bacterium]|jgi:hypothetical protein